MRTLKTFSLKIIIFSTVFWEMSAYRNFQLGRKGSSVPSTAPIPAFIVQSALQSTLQNHWHQGKFKSTIQNREYARGKTSLS